MEIWKNVSGYEGLYMVSNLGRVKSLPRSIGNHSGYIKKECILKYRPNKKGYARVQLCKNGLCKDYLVHRLVAFEFIENKNNYKEVNHIDENVSNNKVENLEWCSRIQNVRHGTGTKRMGIAHRIPVEQYVLCGNYIKTFTHLQAAADEVGGFPTNISSAAKGKNKTSCGYIWKFPANTVVIK